MDEHRLRAAAVWLVFLAAFALKLFFITREPLLYNNDAGYYVEHIREVLRQGYPDVMDPPLAFYYAAAFAAAFGLMLGTKIAVSLASAAIAFPASRLAGYLAGDYRAAILAAFFAAFSPTNMFMMGDLLKNMVGLFFGAWFVLYSLRASDRFAWKDAILAGIFAALMLGSHFSSGAYMLLALSPYLVFRAYGELAAGRRSAEAAFCLAIVGALFLAGVAIALIKGMLSEGAVGVIGMYGESGLNTIALNEYSIFLLPALLGLSRLSQRHRTLLLLWLTITFLLTQPFFTRPEWQMRFAWNAYIPIAVLVAVGLGYFSSERWVFAGSALLLGVFALGGFLHSGQSISPIIYQEEWEGLLRLHDTRPDIVFSGAHGGMEQWIEAAGFEVMNGPGEGRHILVCDSSTPAENGWYAGACMMTMNAGRDEIERMPLTARFGRFYAVPAEAALQLMPMPPEKVLLNPDE